MLPPALKVETGYLTQVLVHGTMCAQSSAPPPLPQKQISNFPKGSGILFQNTDLTLYLVTSYLLSISC